MTPGSIVYVWPNESLKLTGGLRTAGYARLVVIRRQLNSGVRPLYAGTPLGYFARRSGAVSWGCAWRGWAGRSGEVGRRASGGGPRPACGRPAGGAGHPVVREPPRREGWGAPRRRSCPQGLGGGGTPGGRSDQGGAAAWPPAGAPRQRWPASGARRFSAPNDQWPNESLKLTGGLRRRALRARNGCNPPAA
jgi:hypothetical protein